VLQREDEGGEKNRGVSASSGNLLTRRWGKAGEGWGLGDMWRGEKHEKRGLIPTGRGQRGRCGNGPAAARARHSVSAQERRQGH
jgi:hypothetical protein